MSGDGARKDSIQSGGDPRNRPRVLYKAYGDKKVDPGTAIHYNMIIAPVYKEERCLVEWQHWR